MELIVITKKVYDAMCPNGIGHTGRSTVVEPRWQVLTSVRS